MENKNVKFGKAKYKPIWTISEQVPYEKGSGKLYIIKMDCQQITQTIQKLDNEGEILNEFESQRETIQIKTWVKDYRTRQWRRLNFIRADDSRILQIVLDRFTNGKHDITEEDVEASCEIKQGGDVQ